MRPVSLLADIGGTNARFALCGEAGKLRDAGSLRVADFPTFEDALEAYLAGIDGAKRAMVTRAFVAAAGPVGADGNIDLTNSRWRISQGTISKYIGGEAMVLNDVEAIALELPYIRLDGCRAIGATLPPPQTGNRLAVNVGTGFGASIAVRDRDGSWSAVATEAGHMCYAPQTENERRLGGHIATIEDLLSGAGISRAHRLLRENLAGTGSVPPPIALTASDVFAAAGSQPAATAAVLAFSDALARATSDLVLATGSWGGAYLAGSVVKTWADHSDHRRFREVFVGHGKMADRLRDVPTSVVTLPEPALLGLSRLV